MTPHPHPLPASRGEGAHVPSFRLVLGIAAGHALLTAIMLVGTLPAAMDGYVGFGSESAFLAGLAKALALPILWPALGALGFGTPLLLAGAANSLVWGVVLGGAVAFVRPRRALPQDPA